MRKVDRLLYSSAMLMCMGVITLAAQTQTVTVADVVEHFVTIGQEEGTDLEALQAYYEDLAANKKNLNTATEERLSALGLLTPYQVVALMNYRTTYGLFYSWHELRLIPGFTPRDIAFLALFFTLDVDVAPVPQRARHTVLAQVKTAFPRGTSYAPITQEAYTENPNARYLGIPWTRYAQYAFSYGETWQAGLTLESDAGERAVVDYASAHVQYRGRGFLRQVVVGDYLARFGQGLLLWNGFSFGSAGSVAALRRRTMGFSAYTSRNENRFFRGVAVSAAHRDWTFSAFGSFRLLDARITDVGFTSLVETGTHRTPLELAKKNTLGAWVTGVHARYEKNRFQAGATGLLYGYALEDARNILYYNAFQSRANPFGGVSIDGVWRTTSFFFFGEAALAASGSGAALAGTLWAGPDGRSAGLVGRFFSPSYTAAYADGGGRNSTPSNEYSATLSAEFPVGSRLKGGVWTVVSYFPKPRYGCRVPSYGWDMRFTLEGGPFSVRLRQRRSLSDVVTDTYAARFHVQTTLSPAWSLGVRTEWQYVHPASWGRMVYADVVYKVGDLALSWRTTAFHADAWDERLYAYQRDVPHAFSMAVLYGRGVKTGILFKYSPWRWADVWVRVLAEGWDDGRRSVETKVQVRLRL